MMAATTDHDTRNKPTIRKLPKLPKTKTPFISAVKRVEKLLKLADKRLVQSATTTAQSNRGPRKRGRNDGYDEIGEVAAEVERVKRKRQRISHGHNRITDGLDVLADDGMEEVVLKATGKAIQKGLELGEWFRKRTAEYAVKIKTGSVKAIDDVEIPEAQDDQIAPDPGHADDQDSQDAQGEVDGNSIGLDVKDNKTSAMPLDIGGSEVDIPETRIRYISVLEVRIQLQLQTLSLPSFRVARCFDFMKWIRECPSTETDPDGNRFEFPPSSSAKPRQIAASTSASSPHH
nr:hypothetical protein CFP56_20342 [Quercus suber]